jgi:hypothetical protein
LLSNDDIGYKIRIIDDSSKMGSIMVQGEGEDIVGYSIKKSSG